MDMLIKLHSLDAAALDAACNVGTAVLRKPIGPEHVVVADWVARSAQGRGLGAALLRACLLDMRSAGYRDAIVGGVGAPKFFRRAAGAIEIPDSTAGLYAGQLKA